MKLKLQNLDPNLRERIQAQIRIEDDARNQRPVVRHATQPKPVLPLVEVESVDKASARSLEIRVAIISLRKRLMDAHDNLPFAHKGLCDAISATLGVDDSKIMWEFGQMITKGEPSTLVRIQAL